TRFSRDWSSDVCSSDLLGFDFLKADRDGGLSKTEGAELLDTVEVAAWFGGPAVGVADVGFGAIEAVEVYAPGGVGGGFFLHGRRSEERRVGREWRCGW